MFTADEALSASAESLSVLFSLSVTERFKHIDSAELTDTKMDYTFVHLHPAALSGVIMSRTFLLKVAADLSVCVLQGPAAAGRNATGTQQEESGQQSGNHPATDESNSPHQSVSCCTT